jgi:FtsH-binding integral membrane protein
MSVYSNQPDSLLNDHFVPSTTTSKKFMASVFTWMFVALATSAIVAFAITQFQIIERLVLSGNGGILRLFMFLPLLFVLGMGIGYQRLSAPVMTILFIAYAAVNGVAFSIIALSYASSSIMMCFLGAAVMFGIMAVLGYTTDKDLTGFGRLLMMALLGMVIVSLINMFMGNAMMDYILGCVGIAIFTGLTAYDVQKLKNISLGIDENGDSLAIASQKKLALWGALSLYLDFINLFYSLLRVFGGRK